MHSIGYIGAQVERQVEILGQTEERHEELMAKLEGAHDAGVTVRKRVAKRLRGIINNQRDLHDLLLEQQQVQLTREQQE